jgi:hypothetical protein
VCALSASYKNPTTRSWELFHLACTRRTTCADLGRSTSCRRALGDSRAQHVRPASSEILSTCVQRRVFHARRVYGFFPSCSNKLMKKRKRRLCSPRGLHAFCPLDAVRGTRQRFTRPKYEQGVPLTCVSMRCSATAVHAATTKSLQIFQIFKAEGGRHGIGPIISLPAAKWGCEHETLLLLRTRASPSSVISITSTCRFRFHALGTRERFCQRWSPEGTITSACDRNAQGAASRRDLRARTSDGRAPRAWTKQGDVRQALEACALPPRMRPYCTWETFSLTIPVGQIHGPARRKRVHGHRGLDA